MQAYVASIYDQSETAVTAVLTAFHLKSLMLLMLLMLLMPGCSLSIATCIWIYLV
jgi:hypothetical protein